MKRFVLLATVIATFASEAHAQQLGQEASVPKVFTTVDAVSVEGGAIVVITGVVQGESTPSTWFALTRTTTSFDWAGQCERLAMLAMAKPGQYLLEVRSYDSYSHAHCKLTKVTQ